MTLIRRPSSLPALSHSIVRDEMSFAELEFEWDGLYRRALSQTPFLRYPWVRLCWERHREVCGTQLFIVVVRDDRRPVLIAPFVVRSDDMFFLDSLTPQYNDVLIEDSVRASSYVSYLCQTIAGIGHLRRFVSAWVRADSPFAKHLVTVGRSVKTTAFKACFIDLAKFGEWEAYLQSFSRKLRRDHGRQLRNLESRGPVKFRMADASSLDHDVAWLFAQKRQWLDQKRRASDWLRTHETEAFFAAAAREGLGSNRTWLTALSTDSGIVAAMLSFREGPDLYMSKIAHDPAWGAYSPGRTLLLLTIQRAFQHGVLKCDLMTGRSALKEVLATGSTAVLNQKIRVRKPTGLTGRVRHWAKHLMFERHQTVPQQPE